MPDLSFVFAQSLSGLTAAMFLFLIASGLSLIFGVLRVLNFAHGSFYMLGAYGAYQFVQWFGMGPGRFWWAVIGAALGVALLGGIVERLLFRHWDSWKEGLRSQVWKIAADGSSAIDLTPGDRDVPPFAVGGASDAMGRVLSAKLGERLKQQVIVDNRASASGVKGLAR